MSPASVCLRSLTFLRSLLVAGSSCCGCWQRVAECGKATTLNERQVGSCSVRSCSVNVPSISDSNLSCRLCQQSASLLVCQHRFDVDWSLVELVRCGSRRFRSQGSKRPSFPIVITSNVTCTEPHVGDHSEQSRALRQFEWYWRCRSPFTQSELLCCCD